MAILNSDFSKLTTFIAKCNAPGQSYSHTPITLPVTFQLVKANIGGWP
jgi:hypothetical protein